MRKLRILAAGVWYLVGTAVSNREPLFWSPEERARFKQVLSEARARYAFVLCGLRFSGPAVSFYIKQTSTTRSLTKHSHIIPRRSNLPLPA